MSFIADKDYSALVNYAEKMTSDESGVLKDLREHCEAHYEDKSMLSGFFQGRLLAMISRMVTPSRFQPCESATSRTSSSLSDSVT